MDPSATPPSNTAPADEDLAEQARPGHGIPSQDPSPAAQTLLEPEEAEREAKSVLMGGGVMAGAATGAAIGVAVAGPVGVMVGGTLGAVAGALGGAAAGAMVNPEDPSGTSMRPPAQAAMTMTVERLQAFADAWNRHDIEALMTFMTEDCVFEASAGPEVYGTSWVGRDAVKAGFQEVWATYPDARWNAPRHFVCADRGVSQWTFTGTRQDGSRVEVNGCDLFTFRGDRIALKDSYRKNRPALPAGRPA